VAVPVDSPFATPALLGRDAELAQLAATLESGDSQFVVIAGPAGTGKTRLLEAFGELASMRGWIVPAAVEISESTGQEALEPLRTLTEGAPAANPLANSGTVAATVAATKAAADDVDRPRRPLLVRFDGFRPEPAVESWLLDEFLPSLMDEPPVVVAIAVPDVSGRLAELADEPLLLGPPDADALRARLERVGAELAPPASEEEVATMTAALVDRPALIEPLIRALRFARPNA